MEEAVSAVLTLFARHGPSALWAAAQAGRKEGVGATSSKPRELRCRYPKEDGELAVVRRRIGPAGANTGVGFGIARYVAARGAPVVPAVREAEQYGRGSPACESIPPAGLA